MEVYFDARWIGDHGIGRFARMLDDILEFRHLRIGGSPSSPVDPIRMSAAVRFGTPGNSLIFSPGYNAPFIGGRSFVFTIHDLNHIDFPENRNVLKTIYYAAIMRRAARKAERVLTVSEFSRQRIMTWAGVAPDRVVNVGNGLDRRYEPVGLAYDMGCPYLLCVSNRKPHKNEVRLIKAFSNAAIDPSVRLVFTGHSNQATIQLCQANGVDSRVVFLGKVAEDDMPRLYRGATALVFPSLYEGFGLPVIEAMGCGTPVLTSNTTALPEVAGNAAILVDPLSVSEITSGIELLCNDAGVRGRLAAAGRTRALGYSWADVAAKVDAVFSDIRGS